MKKKKKSRRDMTRNQNTQLHRKVFDSYKEKKTHFISGDVEKHMADFFECCSLSEVAPFVFVYFNLAIYH